MRVALAAVAGLTLLALPARAQSFDPAQTEEIGQIVRNYLLTHPEVLEEAVAELKARRDAEDAEAAKAAVAELHDKLFNDPRDFAVGPVDAPVQIVEFFDYNCPYCRASAPWVKQTLAAHPGQIRFVFKETPIFADSKESSKIGARAAVAAIDQQRYLDLHFAFMDQSGTIPASQVKKIAEGAGLNWKRAQGVMESAETAQHLEDDLALLDAIGATGTPAFVANGELIPGADTDRLQEIVQEALGKKEG